MDNRHAKPIRILHVLDKLSVNSGVSSVVLNYWTHFDHLHMVFDFLVNQEPLADCRRALEARQSRIYVLPNPTKAPGAYITSLIQFFKQLDYPYQIIHGHTPNAAVFYLTAARFHGIPHRIIHSHNSRYSDQWYKAVRNKLLTSLLPIGANHYMACSQAAAEFLFGVNAVKTHKVKILPNAIDLKRFGFDPAKRKQMRRKMQLEECFVIGHVGRFAKQKNHLFLLELFANIVREQPIARLLLVGDGEELQAVKKRAASLGIIEQTFFCGTRPDTENYMQMMDCFVLPSLFEGLPVVGIEAQANGLNCIFSDAITQEVAVCRNVEFLPLSDGAKKWANAVMSLYGQQRNSDLQSLKSKGFDIETQTGRLYAYYISLLNG